MPVTVAAVGAGMKAIQGGMAYARERKTARELRELAKQPLPQYSATPQLQKYYSQALEESNNAQGFTPEQQAQFRGEMGKTINARMAGARSIAGGQLNRAVRGTSIADRLSALNQFAAQDAAIARQNRMSALNRLGTATSQMQNLSNMNTANLYQRRMMTEQALGQAQRQNRDIWQQAIGDTGSDLMGAGMNMYAYNQAFPTTPTGVPSSVTKQTVPSAATGSTPREIAITGRGGYDWTKPFPR